jgi:DSF synthase
MEDDCGPVLTHGIVKEFRALQTGFAEKPKDSPHWLVVSSGSGGGPCYQADHGLLFECMRSGDQEQLHDYAHDCMDMLLDNMRGQSADVITIGIVDGDAWGLGFETAMSFDYLVATSRSRFGFPDSEFGMFPGMGAQMFLSRKIGMSAAKQMIDQGRLHDADAMAEHGIVTHQCDPDRIEETVSQIIESNSSRRTSILAARRAMTMACPMSESRLRDIVDIWVDNAMRTPRSEIDRMEERSCQARDPSGG